MALLLSTQLAGINSRPVVKPSGAEFGGRMRRYRATITLASQANADWIQIGVQNPGDIFAFGVITSSVSLATSVIAIGTSATHGTNGQFRAAATFTAVDTPTFFGPASAVSQVAATAITPLYLTSATAALPAAGTLNIDLFFTNG